VLFVYHGSEPGEKVRVVCAVLDGHSRPLINPSIVPADEDVGGRQSFVIESGKSFVVDHTDHARGMNWVCDFMRSHKSFQCLNRELLPKGSRAGDGNAR
jgi:hypothetical protein